MRFQNTNMDADSFEETNLMLENQRKDRILEAQQRRLDMINKALDKEVKEEDDDDKFVFEEYLMENSLEDLAEIGKFAGGHNLKLKSIPIKFQL